MPSLHAERLAPSELPALAAVLSEAALPTEDIAEPGRVFFRFMEGGRLAGFGGYELYGKDVLVRSIVVAAELRGRGLGKRLVERLLADASAAGARRAFLITSNARKFFEAIGFATIDRSQAPGSILATRQAKDICTTTAPLMSRDLLVAADA